MFRDVFIQESLPRDLSTFNSTFMEGLQMERFFGMFFLIGGLVLFGIAMFKFRMIFPSIILLAVAIGGFFLMRKANNRAAERKEIFLNGQVVYAEVDKHGRKFSLFKSKKDYTLTVDIPNKDRNLEIVHKSQELWDKNPIGSQLLGLEYDGKYFFGEEMGCHFKLFNK